VSEGHELADGSVEGGLEGSKHTKVKWLLIVVAVVVVVFVTVVFL